jgi:hypothetical protein
MAIARIRFISTPLSAAKAVDANGSHPGKANASAVAHYLER